jgi:hypothetical protein
MADGDDDDDPLPEGSLVNIVGQRSLKWIFVGGKGGVGKTTTSCCLALRIAKRLELEGKGAKALVVSTDPAHNLSDAFGQKFGRDPVAVAGVSNLFCMEIDASVDVEELAAMGELDGASDDSGGLGGISSIMSELTQSIPGIDEAMSFAELMKSVQTMDYSVIVFDTAPTGHTLRLLSFPTTLEKAFSKLMVLKASARAGPASRARARIALNMRLFCHVSRRIASAVSFLNLAPCLGGRCPLKTSCSGGSTKRAKSSRRCVDSTSFSGGFHQMTPIKPTPQSPGERAVQRSFAHDLCLRVHSRIPFAIRNRTACPGIIQV